MPVVGLALPAIRTAGGYFVSKNPYDTAWGDLIMAIMTPIGGRPMNRQFGSQLPSIIFDPMDTTTESLVQRIIYETASRWCPNVRVLGIDVQSNNRTVSLRISFGLSSDPSTAETRSIMLDRRGTINAISLAGS